MFEFVISEGLIFLRDEVIEVDIADVIFKWIGIFVVKF